MSRVNAVCHLDLHAVSGQRNNTFGMDSNLERDTADGEPSVWRHVAAGPETW